MKNETFLMALLAIFILGFLIAITDLDKQEDITQCLIKTDDNMEVNCFYTGGGSE